ncbi:MAG: hypothetical protein KDA25_05835, partial [Phycisphaerales bacterium]|nr:hypothetical protein [Phycisphaerales bacterium]
MRRSNLATLILAVMVTVLTGAWARPAAAQGMREAIPDPITSAELADYAERLYLSEIQLGAALEFHERYKTQYAAIRDRDIEKLLDDLKALRSLGPHVPSRDTVEDLKRQYERIINKIETID